MHPLVFIAIFLIASVLGYFIIKNVPSLLHTPLMSGTNALSGITILGALFITNKLTGFNQIIGGIGIVLAVINLISGFFVTDRMLKKFTKSSEKK